MNYLHKYDFLLGLLSQPEFSYHRFVCLFFFFNFKVLFKKGGKCCGLSDYLKGVGVGLLSHSELEVTEELRNLDQRL